MGGQVRDIFITVHDEAAMHVTLKNISHSF